MDKKKIKIIIDDGVTLFDSLTDLEIKFNGYIFALEYLKNQDCLQKTISILVDNFDEIREIFSQYKIVRIETDEGIGGKVFRITL